MKAFIFILALAVTVGCGKDKVRTQAAADAVAGIDAMTIIAPETQPIASGVTDHILATRGLERRDQLPEPQMSATAIIADTDRYKAQGKQAIEDSKSLGFVGMLIGAAVAIAAVVKATGLGGPLVNIIASVIESKASKAQKQHASDLAGVATTTFAVLEVAPPEIAGPIKKAISKAVTPEQEAAIRRELAALSAKKDIVHVDNIPTSPPVA